MANADVFAALGKKPMGGAQTTYDEGADTGPIESAAPSAPEAAPAEPTEVSRHAGSGRYEYAKMSDGTIKITKSTRGGAGTVVAQDSPFYDLIMTDITKFNAPGAKAPTAKPAAPKAAAPVAAPKAEAPAAPSKAATAPSKARTETPEEIADRLLTSLDGVPRGEPGPEFGGMGEVRRSETEPSPTPKFEPPASMVGPSDYDKRKELASYHGGISGNLKLASLSDDAQAGLVRTKMDPKAAKLTVSHLMSGMSKGDYNSLVALKSFAAM